MFFQFYGNLEESYLTHIENVKQKVPDDRLLIWNVKDGWEPLCKFLEKPIPNIPVPLENATGDPEYMKNYMKTSEFYKEMMTHLKWNILKIAVYGIATGSIFYQYKMGQLNLDPIRAFLTKNFSKFEISL